VLTELLNRRGMRAGGGILYDGPFHNDPRLKDHIGLS
jgi:hypothetical protein